ncbi:MAG: GyrI-like domain-containing protein [Acidimicrobiales bacterium]|nr:GyrI-like domain-containing protein [Acidimicrobiales bacterium]
MGRAAMVDVHEIEDRALERRPTIVGRSIVFVDEIGPWLQHTYERLVVTVPAAGGSFCGPPFARFTPLGGSGSVEVEAGFPVMAHVPVDDDLVPAHLPGGPAAVTWHTGPYESLETAYRDLSSWLRHRGVRPNGAAWEVYHPPALGDPTGEQVRTELVQPYLLD